MRRSMVLMFAAALAICGPAAAETGARGAAASRPTSTSAPASTSAPGVRAVHVFVTGKVQGVGFRDWTVAEARQLQLTGWVKNLSDGRVEAVLEGASGAVAAMLQKMKKGPSTARVDDLKAADEKPTLQFKTFERQ